mmetsp:Transcript_16793/g.32735  ORF Transcript_16793/g.32735 Transcript_16793/m.32735 type:complete len:112 (+) Transcript_16793:1682-2017(+)
MLSHMSTDSVEVQFVQRFDLGPAESPSRSRVRFMCARRGEFDVRALVAISHPLLCYFASCFFILALSFHSFLFALRLQRCSKAGSWFYYQLFALRALERKKRPAQYWQGRR